MSIPQPEAGGPRQIGTRESVKKQPQPYKHLITYIMTVYYMYQYIIP